MKSTVYFITALVTCAVFTTDGMTASEFEGVKWVDDYGYERCIELSNDIIRVVLEPNCGGRVIEYAIGGVNALAVDRSQDGWTFQPGETSIDPGGGRFDIGPEMKAPRRPFLWIGPWVAEITGPRSAKMTSVPDKSAGVQLIREFRLDEESSYLRCKQTIVNTSDETKQYNHWSRTFAEGGGICLVPLTDDSRFPAGYITYGPGPVLNYRHDPHPHYGTRDGFLEITGPTPQRKYGVDTRAGWLGYITPSDILFVKKFPVYPDRAYGEVAAYTVSIWYDERKVCELEPIGPLETIPPGGRASFTEDWWLFPYEFPGEGGETDLAALTAFVKENARAVAIPGTKPEKIAGDCTWAEGPAEAPDGTIYFTDNRENKIYIVETDGSSRILIEDGKKANGMFPDRDGRIIACTGSPKALVSMDSRGKMDILADSYNGEPFNAPNDCWVDSKGGVYFTDPYWGKEKGRSRVYYLAPDRKTLIPVIMDMTTPNGVIGSPDGSRLYVSDWLDKKTWVYNVNPDGTVYGKCLFAPEGDDGMTVDTDGNVYLTGEAVTVYDPDGMKIDTIEVPETPANVIFAGEDRQTLIITARTSVYSIRLKSRKATP